MIFKLNYKIRSWFWRKWRVFKKEKESIKLLS